MTRFVHLLSRLASAVEPRERPHARAAVSVGATIAAMLLALTFMFAPESAAQGGFLEELFGFHSAPRAPEAYFYGEQPSWRHSARRHRRFARHSFHRGRYAMHKRAHVADASPPAANGGAHAVCVRSCDGFFFPLANASSRHGGSGQGTCASVCPDAEARLFLMPSGSDNIADARAEDGELYTQFVARIAARTDKPKSCACHVIADDAVETRAVMNDPTLRPGDTVVTSEGVKVFAGGDAPYRKSSFLSLAETPNLSPSKRGALAAIDRAIKTPVGRAVLLYPEKRRSRPERRADARGEQRGDASRLR